DCLVRRQRRNAWRWDPVSRQSWTEEELFVPKDTLVPIDSARAPDGTFHQKNSRPAKRMPKNGKLFSYRTRYYLRRRVWRYFRHMGFRAASQYPAAIAQALVRYTDEDLAQGENILDSWCLLNICFRAHPALRFTPNHVQLNEGHTLSELSPSPKFARAWTTPQAAQSLWELIADAQSRLVRVWAMALLKAHHQEFLASLTAEQLLPLFDSFDDEVVQFATSALEKLPSLASLPIAMWLKLLEAQNPSALAVICELMTRQVSHERLDLPQTVAMAKAKSAPVAKLGLAFLRRRSFAAPGDRLMLSDLALGQCEAVAPVLTAFALSILGTKESYDVTLVSRFFDALLVPTRLAAWEWLAPQSPGYGDPQLWVRLIETPYEDIRLRLVRILQTRATLPGTSLDQLAPIWTSVLLGIHRGGRHKIIALHQISRWVIEHPDSAEVLLPVLALAIRSVRVPEMQAGLAAVAQLAEQNPALSEAAQRAIPEMRFLSAGATT
ncbi:MAG TPA: hypothetical protein VFW23_19185, partial [Tepidisphaeraceae bacterium]|nr:hypothetical protein [Tepidisphaeraceae bacterium]